MPSDPELTGAQKIHEEGDDWLLQTWSDSTDRAHPAISHCSHLLLKM